MKVIMVLLDGLGDRSYAELDHRTPLAAAKTPNLDKLAARGANGLFHASFPGECLPSETAHYLMFGYDRPLFPGRGLLEAVGEKVPFDDKDVLVLAHLSGVEFRQGAAVLSYGRDDIGGTKAALRPLYERLTSYETNGVRFELHHTRRNDAILRISGDVSPDVSDSDPILTGNAVARVMPVSGSKTPKRAKKTADALNRYLTWCHEQLESIKKAKGGTSKGPLPNFLVTQRAGRRVPLEPFCEKWGFAPAMIASGSVYGGLANELGLDFVRVKDGNSPGRDLAARIQVALDDADHDFIHVHTKVPDEVSHHGNPEQKRAAIAKLDAGFKVLMDALTGQSDLLAVITADHSTPSRSPLVHSGETVPVIFAGGAIRRDQVDRFDEIAAAGGSLGFLRGAEMMHMILNSADRAILSGLQLGPDPRPYVPAAYPAFASKRPARKG